MPLAAAAEAVSDIALYTGRDRAERIAAGARKEGSLNLYTSLTVEDMGSANGTYVRISGSAKISQGDLLLLGEQILRIDPL